jgi:hypothetical protein
VSCEDHSATVFLIAFVTQTFRVASPNLLYGPLIAQIASERSYHLIIFEVVAGSLTKRIGSQAACEFIVCETEEGVKGDLICIFSVAQMFLFRVTIF